MALPLSPPIKPQLALSRKTLPEGEEWAYEPKWDGFRGLAFVDGDEVFLQSRNGRPLLRYFPELRFPGGEYVVDGELVVVGDDGGEEFGSLQQRIHPAESRINMLAQRFPVTFRAFDVLVLDGKDVTSLPLCDRREALEGLIDRFSDPGSLELTPVADSVDGASGWLESGEGVIAKRLDSPYRFGERKGMVKVKRLRSADCVVVGWRPGKEAGTVGSLILGLYEESGRLRVVGHTSGFKAKEKRELVEKLAPYETGERGSGEVSRWTADRDLEWITLCPELVVEISFDHVADGRIRHGTKIQRWRDDKDPADCTYDQLDQ
ncbi:MAG: ATP-dependent DNA ligase [Solirubrobacterales bacterium]